MIFLYNLYFDISLPISGNMSLKLYNALGDETATICNDYRNSGNYRLIFNSTNFPNGVYFYKLTLNDRQITGKLTIVK